MSRPPHPEHPEVMAELERLRIENAYLKDTSPSCAAEAVREKERADRYEQALLKIAAHERVAAADRVVNELGRVAREALS